MDKFVSFEKYLIFFTISIICLVSISNADFIALGALEKSLYAQTIPETITIDTLEKFLAIGKETYLPLNGNYILETNLDLSGGQTTGELNSKISGLETYLSEGETEENNEGYEPIGTDEAPFTGTFNGNGHKITGLYINRPTSANVGLFGVLSATGRIEKLGVENYVIRGNEQVGGIVGKNLGVIERCYSSGSVEATNNAGGFVGVNFGSIRDSFSMSYIKGEIGVGGLVGKNEGGKVENTYFVGKVGGDIKYGGLIGVNNDGEVIASYWDKEKSGLNISSGGTGKTTIQMGKENTYADWDFDNVWGFSQSGTYPYLLALGQVTFPDPPNISISTVDQLQKIGKSLDYPWFGNYNLTATINAKTTEGWNSQKGFEPITKFCGTINGKGYKIRGLYIKRADTDNVGLIACLSPGGKVTRLILENCQITGSWKVGGLVGKNVRGTIENCKVTNGQIKGDIYVGGLIGQSNGGSIVKSSVSGTVEGYDTVGGILGQNIDTSIIACGTSAQIKGDINLGGFVGLHSSGSISECYSTGTINEPGSQFVGGFVGNNAGHIINCYSTSRVIAYSNAGGFSGTNSNTIEKCYSVGVVRGTSTDAELETVGGFNGLNKKGKFNFCYWDMEASRQKESDGAFAATTLEMKCNTTYTGWDFVGIWFIRNGVEYPVLRWQGNYEGEDMGSCEIVEEGTTEGEGIAEGIHEGTAEGEGIHEGTAEGEGTHEGTTEGEGIAEGIHEGTAEGEGTHEGTTEGEGSSETENGCGCNSSDKGLFDNLWKHLFDFITIGLLLSLMSGMYIKRK
ncbi:MAG TPA: GLUG motif-containing protein [Candidatus Hydrogenedens sp.]|nr:GLUG motif-containing protein [Candidatus Hydrogenedens sp.]